MGATKKELQLGDRVKCKVTEFEGVVLGRAVYLTSVPTCWVQPTGLGQNGQPIEPKWIDEGRLQVCGEKMVGFTVREPHG
jgi:hypothetical protein